MLMFSPAHNINSLAELPALLNPPKRRQHDLEFPRAKVSAGRFLVQLTAILQELGGQLPLSLVRRPQSLRPKTINSSVAEIATNCLPLASR